MHARDVEPRGSEHLSEAQRSLIRRASTIEIQLEAMEGQLSEGKNADISSYAATAGHLKRILETLGIERRKRNITPSVEEYVAHLNKIEQEADAT